MTTAMPRLELAPVQECQKPQFIAELQQAFQKGYEDVFGPLDGQAIHVEDIEHSFNAPGSEAYFAVLDGAIVGGTVLVIDDETHRNNVDLLYVKVGCQNKGIGQAIWRAIEAQHPETDVWGLCTPYYEKRNVYFYINKLGFHAVEFFDRYHPDPNDPNPAGEMPPEVGYDFLRFEKVMHH